MSQRMAAPAGVSPGCRVIFPDGSLGTVGTDRTVTCPDSFVTALLSSGYQTTVSTNPTAGIGYGTGAGGAVTQTGSKSTAATLNNACGTITMNAASLAAGAEVTFTLTNAAVGAGDLVLIDHVSAGTSGAYAVVASNTGVGGTVDITVTNLSAGALAEAIVLGFAVVKIASA